VRDAHTQRAAHARTLCCVVLCFAVTPLRLAAPHASPSPSPSPPSPTRAAFNVRNSIADEKVKAKLSEADRKTIEAAVDGALKWLRTTRAEREEFEERQKALEATCSPIMQKLYAAAARPRRHARRRRMPGGGSEDAKGRTSRRSIKRANAGAGFLLRPCRGFVSHSGCKHDCSAGVTLFSCDFKSLVCTLVAACM